MGEIINPNEYGGLLYDEKEANAVREVILNEKIFRYATKEKSKTDLFEEAICRKFEKQYALGINSGTSALKVALKAIGIKNNDRILISSYTFLATATSVLSLGGIPVPIEFDSNYGMDLLDLETEIKKGCKAIILVHLQGKCFDIKPIIDLKKKYNIVVIEDACQAMGTRNKGIYAGTLSDIGIFSFQQNKPITSGEGGVIITDNKQYYTVARNYSDMGSVREYFPSWEKDGALIGDNYRMNNIQGAILREQLLKFDDMIDVQRKNKKYILDNINRKNMTSEIVNDFSQDDAGINILILAKDEDMAKQSIEIAKERNVEIRYLWNKTYYMHKVMKDAELTPKDFGKKECILAEKISKSLISISLPPVLSKNQLETIIEVINELIEKRIV